MSTPICDFVRRYRQSDPVRFHMPGHKGYPFLGFEPLDITEIDGADELFTASGVIAESEAQASALFGAHTVYSAGGSTLCIQTMLHMAARYGVSRGERPLILAARNAHKAFVNSAALLDLDVIWLYPQERSAYVSCPVTASQISRALQNAPRRVTAVYLTSPDYLGNMLDISGIARVCRENGVLLLVDNAHGAYLKFLPAACHPMDQGADLCCDSAHKTLGVITGGAYLHISPKAPAALHRQAKAAMSLFASSSPSYLILQSLDAANDRMTAFRDALSAFLPKADALKQRLSDAGYVFAGDEPLKLTLAAKGYGYTGQQLAQRLMDKGIYPEFYDPDYVVLMLSPVHTEQELGRLEQALCHIPKRPTITAQAPALPHPAKVLSPRQAMFLPSERVPVQESCGRISAAAAISCPPAVPLVICGERIDEQTVGCLKYYGVDICEVIAE